jgi:pyruvate,water dikinase
MSVEPWPFDLPGDPDYPMYMRGQAEEVLPGVLTPMMCTFGAPIIESGWKAHFTETLPIIDPPRHPHTFIAVYGGRTYMNLSTSARSAVIMGGSRPEDFAQQFDVGADFIAAAQRQPGDDERAARAHAVLGDGLASPPREQLASDRGSALERRAEGRARRSSLSPEELLARARALVPETTRAFSRIMLAGTLEGACFAQLNDGLAKRYGDDAPALARELLSGVGDVDSAAPAQRLATLATLSGDAYRQGFTSFLEDFGFRGANEFEISAPSWEMAPDAVERMVEAARNAPAKEDPAGRGAAALARTQADGLSETWPEFEWWLQNTGFFVGARERAKGTFVILYNEIRLDLFEIGRRLVAKDLLPTPASVFLLTEAELESTLAGHGGATDSVDDRARHMAQLATLVPPAVVKVGEVPPVDTWETKTAAAAGHESAALRGVAGSPGIAQGRVRVVLDPYDDIPPEPGEVLVAPFTDPGWTLMFMAADAVVVEVGGALSHAVVVARELGIPAVVSVENCCRLLQTGDLIEVDGNAGTVRVLERKS